MKLNEAERIIALNALCTTRNQESEFYYGYLIDDIQSKVNHVCLNIRNCKKCPYYNTYEEVTEALKVLFEYYTPRELQNKIQEDM